MPSIHSKLAPVDVTCQEFLHPWTDNCWNSTAGILLHATQHSVRIYSVVYALSLIMRHRIPTFNDLKKTVLGVLQSSAFLATNGFAYFLFTCLIRNAVGHFNFATFTVIPAFAASLSAILLERPVRRPLLALYVANVATESIWRMLESRGCVQSIPNGQAIIFGIGVSILLYIYRLGKHKTVCKDSLFDILRIFVGRTEEGPLNEAEPQLPDYSDAPQRQPASVSRSNNYTHISGLVYIYAKFIDSLKSKHESCPHKGSCVHYSFLGGLRPLIGGIGLQVILKLVLSFRRIIQFKMQWKRTIFNRSTLKLGIFLGSFSFLYKAVSCSLRHLIGRDNPLYAIPAGLIGSIMYTQYPDITVALYVFWKMLQVSYNIAIDKELLPKVPGFTIILYTLSTTLLFQAAIFEPLNLRPSYWKFLDGLSGHRVGIFDRTILDRYVPTSSTQLQEVFKRTGTGSTNVAIALS